MGATPNRAMSRGVARPSVVLAVGAIAAASWFVVAFFYRDPMYGILAVAASSLGFGGTVALAMWEPPAGKNTVRVLAAYIIGMNFIQTGLPVLQEVRLDELPVPADMPAYSQAVLGALLFSSAQVLGLLLTAPARTVDLLTTDYKVPLPLVAIAALVPTYVLWARAGTSAGAGPLGTLPTIVFNPVVFAAMAFGMRGRKRWVALGILAAGQLLTVLLTSMLYALMTTVLAIVVSAMVLQIRIPWKLLAAAVVLITLLNPAKAMFRYQWGERVDDKSAVPTLQEGGSLWVEAILDTWLSGRETEGDRAEKAGSFARRLGNNDGPAAIYYQVPTILPFEYGNTYVGIPYSLIPRVLYPEKQATGEMTKTRWTVALGLQTWESAEGTTITIPAAAEAYWNFGWLGVPAVGFVIGAIMGLLLYWSPKASAIAHVGYIMALAMSLGHSNDNLFTIIPGIPVVIVTALVVRLVCVPDQQSGRPVPAS